MTEDDYKLEFAKLLQRVRKDQRLNSQPLIAKAVIGPDYFKYPQFLLKIADEWPLDPLVLAEVDRIDRIVVEKDVILNDLYHLASDPYAAHADRIKAFAEYAKISGWTLTRPEQPEKGSDRLKELAAMVLDESPLPQHKIG